jgi:hypothetical protein
MTKSALSRASADEDGALPTMVGLSTGVIDTWRQAVDWWRSAEIVHAGALEAAEATLDAARAGIATAHDWRQAMVTAFSANAACLEQLRARQSDLAFSAYSLGAGMASTFLAALGQDAREEASALHAAPSWGSLASPMWADVWMSPWMALMPRPLALP